jgi:hypothetical protein
VNRNKGILAIAGIAVAGLITAACILGRQPRYGGKTLDEWSSSLQEVSFRVSDAGGIELEITNAAIRAILSAGTNALPWLRSELLARDSRLQNLRYWVYRLPGPLERLAFKVPFVRPGPPETQRRLNAGMAALVLGEAAK